MMASSLWRVPLLVLPVAWLLFSTVNGFVTQFIVAPLRLSSSCFQIRHARSPSRVQDPDGPTPVLDAPPMEEIDPQDVEGLAEVMREEELPHPIPHQPWRRGDTAGCEAPIDAEWRRETEEHIYKAVSFVGGHCLDVTWFLTSMLITIDETKLPQRDLFKDRGPVVNVYTPKPPQFGDPDHPPPKDIWGDEEDILYQRETPEEAQERQDRLYSSYAKVSEDDNDDPNQPHIPEDVQMDNETLFVNTETRQEMAGFLDRERQKRNAEAHQRMELQTVVVETDRLSILGQAILDALEPLENKNLVLARHELILSAPPPAGFLETQKQFNKHRDRRVIVETIDPFDSNRTLKGRLLDRNSMDLLLNIKGRMVTVPLNFVKCVRLAPRLSDDEEEEEYEDEEADEPDES